jgi:hypothetical protein
MEGGSRANNPWVEHVKKYAKENNITYACAITEAKKTYTKVDKNEVKNKQMEVLKKKWRNDINKNFSKVLRENPESLPSLRLKLKTRNKGYREYMKQVAPNMYDKLTEKIGKYKKDETLMNDYKYELKQYHDIYYEPILSFGAIEKRIPPNLRKSMIAAKSKYNEYKTKLEQLTNREYPELKDEVTIKKEIKKEHKKLNKKEEAIIKNLKPTMIMICRLL